MKAYIGGEGSGRMKWIRVFLLCLLIVMVQLPFLQLKTSFGQTGAAGAIDVYTQKPEPYSGKGPNQPSDAFASQDEVILYALVTYNGEPARAGYLVGFELNGPVNPTQNITLTRSAQTDANGIANTTFRIPSPSVYTEQVVFGTWKVFSNVNITDVTFMDTLSFQVGWVLQILSVETVDSQNAPKTSFKQGELMRFKVAVKNIAFTGKVATIVVAAVDNQSYPVGQVVLRDVTVQPGISTYYIGNLTIPDTSAVGLGLASTNAYSAPPSLGGVPLGPEIATIFQIVPRIRRDVAVISVAPSPTKVYQGGVVSISVVVENNGQEAENFTVRVLFDFFSVGNPVQVENLAVGTNKTLTFSWDTTSVVIGQYTLSAQASAVPGEANLADNTYVYGIVSVLPLPPPSPPPLAVSIAAERTSIVLGQSVTFASFVTGGTLPYSYQWYLNESAVTDATSFLWVFTPTLVGQFNVYLQVRDSVGTTQQSNRLTLQVAPPPLPPLELSWLLLLILLIALVVASLFGFAVGRRSKKGQSSNQQKFAFSPPSNENSETRKEASKSSGVFICRHCGIYSVAPRRDD